MRRDYKHIIFVSALIITVIYSCVEPFEVATQNFEDLLVVEATITNEFKYQKIKLGRTYSLEDEGPAYEINAKVTIIEDAQNSYDFQEIDSGIYLSLVKFKAEIGKSYQLLITRSNGRAYTSIKQQITSEKGLDSVYAEKAIDGFGNEGVSIFVDSYDPSGSSKYYRYEYEETYKVIPPYASGFDAIEVTYEPPVYKLIPRTEGRVCYKTIPSNTIMQLQTVGFLEDRVTKFPILFINERDYKTIYRYSILVSQYVQSLDSYTFYKTLNKFSDSKNVFSQIQTGYFSGNVFSTDDEEEKVLGFFELASVSSQRIYFNHHDFFPDNPFPRYFRFCSLISPYLESNTLGGFAGSPLLDALNSGDWVFYEVSGDPDMPLILVETQCGDCSSFASSIKPDFWID
jgi:Domain of unknown function (DUF4249)